MLQTNTLSYDFGSANPERSTHASGEMISAGYLQNPPLFLFFWRKLSTRQKNRLGECTILASLYGSVVQHAVVQEGLHGLKTHHEHHARREPR